MKIAVQTAINVHHLRSSAGIRVLRDIASLRGPSQCKGHNGRPGRLRSAGAAVEADHLAARCRAKGGLDDLEPEDRVAELHRGSAPS